MDVGQIPEGREVQTKFQNNEGGAKKIKRRVRG